MTFSFLFFCWKGGSDLGIRAFSSSTDIFPAREGIFLRFPLFKEIEKLCFYLPFPWLLTPPTLYSPNVNSTLTKQYLSFILIYSHIYLPHILYKMSPGNTLFIWFELLSYLIEQSFICLKIYSWGFTFSTHNISL